MVRRARSEAEKRIARTRACLRDWLGEAETSIRFCCAAAGGGGVGSEKQREDAPAEPGVRALEEAAKLLAELLKLRNTFRTADRPQRNDQLSALLQRCADLTASARKGELQVNQHAVLAALQYLHLMTGAAAVVRDAKREAREARR